MGFKVGTQAQKIIRKISAPVQAARSYVAPIMLQREVSVRIVAGVTGEIGSRAQFMKVAYFDGGADASTGNTISPGSRRSAFPSTYKTPKPSSMLKATFR